MRTAELRKIRLAYKNMLNRCDNPKSASFRHYGARGITVCDEWRASRAAFEFWAEESHEMHLSLDRIDNDAGYSPQNCRWASMTTQLRNQRRNVRIEHDGVVLTQTEWAEKLGLLPSTLARRLKLPGMTVQRALSSANLRDAAPIEHGTRRGYEQYGCRCLACRASNARRAAVRRAQKVAAHGQA